MTAFDVTVRCVLGGAVDEVVCRVRARNATAACRIAEEKARGCAVFVDALAPPGSEPRWRVGYVLVGDPLDQRLGGTARSRTRCGANGARLHPPATFTSVVRI